MKKTFLLLSILACLLTGCTGENENGTINVRINEDRGISADLNASYYILSFTGKDGATIPDVRLDGDNTNTSQEVSAGTWTVTAVAYNRSNVEIGSGSNTVDVYPKKNSPCNISIKEKTGSGNLEITLENTPGLPYKANLYKSSDWQGKKNVISKDIALDSQSGKYKVLFENLSNGYYMLEIVTPTDEQILMTTVRIGAGQTVSFTAPMNDNGKLDITINNDIKPVPDIVIYGLRQFYYPNDIFEVDIAAKGYENAVFHCQINGKEFAPNDGTYMKFKVNSHFNIGENVLKCTLIDGDTVWDKEFIVKVNDGKPDTIEITGNTIFILDQDVLFPHDLSVRLDIGSKQYKLEGERPTIYYRYIAPDVITKATVEAPYDGIYSAYLVEKKTDRGSEVHVVIDRNIENPAYLEIKHDYPYVLEFKESVGVSFLTSETELGFIVGPDKTNTKLKVEAGTYRMYSQWKNHLLNSLPLLTDPFEFTIDAGKTQVLSLYTNHNAPVNFAFPEGINTSDMLLDRAKGAGHTFIRIKDGTNYFKPEERNFFFLSEKVPFHAYESEKIQLTPDVPTTVTLTEKIAEPTVTSFQVPAGNVSLAVNQHVLANSHAYVQFRIGDTYKTVPFIGLQNQKFNVSADAPLEYTVWNIDPEIRITMTLSPDGKTIIMDIDKDIPEPAYIKVDSILTGEAIGSTSFYIYDSITNGGIINARETGSNTLKVVPGTYNFNGQGGWNCPVDHTHTPIKFDIKAGETVTITWDCSDTPR